MGRIRSLFVIAALLGGIIPFAGAAAATTPRVDLRVLVVTDGTPWTDGIRQQLASEGVPTTVVNLGASGRSVITAAFLADQLSDGTPHAKFQGVVLPSEAPAALTSDEQSALAAFEQRFGVRQIDGFVYPNPAIGLNYPAFAGSLDGVTTAITPAALADPLKYLRGPVKFEDNDPAVAESYGYLATPLSADPATGASFEPFMTATIPGTSAQGTLAGVYRKSGREQLVLGFAYNSYQQQFRLLAHGLVDWVTRGVHLGYYRNYFNVHVDDVLNVDSRWSAPSNCTPGEGDCPAGTPETTPIRMSAADVSYAVGWQQQNGFTMDMLFNAVGSVDAIAQAGSDPLTTAYLANRNQFRWLNHTYSHPFLGCVQDFTTIPWRCTTSAGQPVWVSQQEITNEINQNISWANAHGLAIRKGELVAGEHSGTKILPQQPSDNPHFVAALTATGITSLGLDASREPAPRQVGSAYGLPRHPMNVFYNVATPAEEVDEYNWIYTSRANGGSGICEDNPGTTTCIQPLDLGTGFASYIQPKQVQITLGFVLSNDPRPNYVHQSNLTEGRLLYPVVGGVLSAYRGAFATNTPVVNQTFTAAAQDMRAQNSWAQVLAGGAVAGYVQGGVVTVTGPRGVSVPITTPNGTRINGLLLSTPYGDAYAGERSAYPTIGFSPIQLALPSVLYPTTGPTTATTTVAGTPPTATATASRLATTLGAAARTTASQIQAMQQQATRVETTRGVAASRPQGGR